MKKLLLLWLLLPLLVACDKKKKEDNYPKVTSEGLNIWACKINGEPVIYRGEQGFTGGGVKASVYGSAYITSVLLTGSGKGYKGFNDHQNIQFGQPQPEIGKTYYFNTDPCFFEYYNTDLNIDYPLFKSFLGSGWLVFSKIDGVVSGEFETQLTNKSGDTFKITEGRFDIKRF